jgi:hypothetical protein
MAAKPDFWSALDTYVRPAITCRITLEMDLNQNVVGSQATTISTSLLPNGNAPGDKLVFIGGIVRNATVPTQTIANAWILLDSSLVTYTSDADGAFRIPRHLAGTTHNHCPRSGLCTRRAFVQRTGPERNLRHQLDSTMR